MILRIIWCFEYEKLVRFCIISYVQRPQNPKIMHGTSYQKYFSMLANNVNNLFREFKIILLTLNTIFNQLDYKIMTIYSYPFPKHHIFTQNAMPYNCRGTILYMLPPYIYGISELRLLFTRLLHLELVHTVRVCGDRVPLTGEESTLTCSRH